MFEEHKYEELKKLGTELHIPIFEAFWKLEVSDKNGVLLTSHSQRSHSWVRNAYNMLFMQMSCKATTSDTFAAGELNVKDTGGTVRHSTNFGYGVYHNDDIAELSTNGYRAPAATETYGIQVGSGTNAESFEDFVLQTLIADGTGSGELNYVAVAAPIKTYTAGTKVMKVDWIRYLNNNSGGNVSVNEVALTTRGSQADNRLLWVMSRDLLGATVTVADTGQLKVTYTIQITFAG